MGRVVKLIAAVRERASRHAVFATAVFLVASIVVTAVGRGERSGWTLMTSPTGYDHRTNTMLGYCWLWDGRPFMKENIPCVTQTAVFGGSLEALRAAEYREDFRFIRGFYSFAASLLTPVLDVVPAMLFVNWLSWATCAAVSWRLAREVSGSETAGLLAVAFVAGGMGMTVHIGDYSPHLLAFATYYLGFYLLYRSEVWQESRPFRVHVAIGLYMAIACLAYNTGVMLVAVYLVSAVWKNRLPGLAVASVVALSARSLWRAALGSRVVDVEAEYFGRAVEGWKKVLLGGDPWLAIKTAGHWVSELLFFFDSPGVVLVGLACCLFIRVPWRLKVMGLAAVVMPMLAAFVFVPSATARGYLVYAGTVWVYCCLAVQVAGWLQDPRRWGRWGAGAVVVVLLGSHFAWSTAHLWNQLGPVKTYFLGWDDGRAYFSPPTEVVSLTGREPTPVLFGGSASLIEAGAGRGPADHRLSDGLAGVGVAMLSRGFFVAYLAALAAIVARRRRAVAAAGVIGGAALLSALAPIGLKSVPAFFPVDQAVVIPAGGVLRYEVEVAPETAVRLAEVEGDVVGFFFRLSRIAPVEVSVFADGEPLPVVRDPDPDYNSLYRLEAADGARRLTRAERLTLVITNPTEEAVPLSGWQHVNLLGRGLTISGPEGEAGEKPLALPAFEVRVAGEDGRLRFVGF